MNLESYRQLLGTTRYVVIKRSCAGPTRSRLLAQQHEHYPHWSVITNRRVRPVKHEKHNNGEKRENKHNNITTNCTRRTMISHGTPRQ
jgi:hypothetical protein